jgi:hypothetical protein
MNGYELINQIENDLNKEIIKAINQINFKRKFKIF